MNEEQLSEKFNSERDKEIEDLQSACLKLLVLFFKNESIITEMVKRAIFEAYTSGGLKALQELEEYNQFLKEQKETQNEQKTNS